MSRMNGVSWLPGESGLRLSSLDQQSSLDPGCIDLALKILSFELMDSKSLLNQGENEPFLIDLVFIDAY